MSHLNVTSSYSNNNSFLSTPNFEVCIQTKKSSAGWAVWFENKVKFCGFAAVSFSACSRKAPSNLSPKTTQIPVPPSCRQVFHLGLVGFCSWEAVVGNPSRCSIGAEGGHPCLCSPESAGLQAGKGSQSPVTANKPPGSMKGVPGPCIMPSEP